MNEEIDVTGITEIKNYRSRILFPEGFGVHNCAMPSTEKIGIFLGGHLDKEPVGLIYNHWYQGEKWYCEFRLWNDEVQKMIQFYQLSCIVSKRPGKSGAVSEIVLQINYKASNESEVCKNCELGRKRL